MSKAQLYFIALIPHPELREKVLQLKEEMKARFEAKHALKSPAHLTLQMPFKRQQKAEPVLIQALHQFASEQTSFPVILSGFDCFAPKVIYVKVEDHLLITHLHTQFQKMLIEKLGFSSDEVNAKFHPHMTIATRDLRKPAFRKAWPEFEKREFRTSFVAKSLFLLKHNGKSWDIFREFWFGAGEK